MLSDTIFGRGSGLDAGGHGTLREKVKSGRSLTASRPHTYEAPDRRPQIKSISLIDSAVSWMCLKGIIISLDHFGAVVCGEMKASF